MLGACPYGAGKPPVGGLIRYTEPRQFFEGFRIDAIVGQFFWEMVGDIGLGQDGKVPEVVGDGDAQPGCRLRIGAMPQRAVKCD